MPELCRLSGSCASHGWYGGIVSGAIDADAGLHARSRKLLPSLVAGSTGDIDPAELWWGEKAHDREVMRKSRDRSAIRGWCRGPERGQ